MITMLSLMDWVVSRLFLKGVLVWYGLHMKLMLPHCYFCFTEKDLARNELFVMNLVSHFDIHLPIEMPILGTLICGRK